MCNRFALVIWSLCGFDSQGRLHVQASRDLDQPLVTLPFSGLSAKFGLRSDFYGISTRVDLVSTLVDLHQIELAKRRVTKTMVAKGQNIWKEERSRPHSFRHRYSSLERSTSHKSRLSRSTLN